MAALEAIIRFVLDQFASLPKPPDILRQSTWDAMPQLFRRHLVCFYCGGKSAQTQDGTVLQFRCKNCDAVNYLDSVRSRRPIGAGSAHSNMSFSFLACRMARLQILQL
jgi:hypothetical protein